MLFANSGHFLTHFYVLLFPALVMPVSRDFGLSLAETVKISFPMYLCYGALSFPWGWLSDKRGPKWALGSGVCLAGLGCCAAFFSYSPSCLAAALALTGIGCSAYHPSGVALISKGIRRRGTAMGINGAFGNAGIAAAPLAAGVLTYFFGWRAALVMVGAVGILVGISCLLAPISVGRDEDSRAGKGALGGKAARQLIAIMLMIMLVGGLFYRGWTLILPAFFELRLAGMIAALKAALPRGFADIAVGQGFATLVATLITSAVVVLGIVGQVIGGRIADRYELKKAYLAFYLIAFPFLILMSFLSGGWLVFAATVFATFILGIQPIENSLIAMITPARWRGISYAAKFTVVFGIGAASVYLVAMVERARGLDGVMWFLVSLLTVATLLAVSMLLAGRGVDIRQK